MARKLRKAVAFLLIAVLFVQQCSVVSLAGEGEAAEEQEEAPDPEMSDPEVTEPEPSETQAPETTAPETQAPETAAPETAALETAAPETAAPETQAPETTAPETQAAETQADTAESEEKAETEAEPESESESETERSDRENTGDPVTGSDLASMLSSALPYLFVTGDLSFSANEEDPSIPEDWILDGDNGSDVVSDLKSSATILANATSSFDVTVVNLYADENGSLDTAQLDAIFPDQVIDVTDTYYLVNVIADSQTQELSFSGFAMKEDGETLAYTEETQPGAVLYNFAAYDETTYQDYTGTLHLSGGFQGTVLAPTAFVQVEGDLSGAAYADEVKVTDAYADLMKIVFYEGIEEETETESETEEAQTEVSSETETEVIEDDGTESETDIESVPEPVTTIKPLEGEGTISVTAKVSYGNTSLIPVENIENVSFAALFVEEGDGTYTLVDGVEPVPLEFTADTEEGTCELTFQELDTTETTYYVLATDEEGEPISEGAFSVAPSEVKFSEDGLSGKAELDYVYSEDWGDLFYYSVSLTISVSLTGHKGENYSVENETFSYKVDDADVEVQVKNDYKGSEEIDLKATAPKQEFHIEETPSNPAFTISSFDSNITVTCGEGDPVSVTKEMKYKLNDTVVKLKIIGKDTGKTLSGATFIIVQKDDDGTWEKVAGPYSGSETLTNSRELKEDATYYLYEINASSGYAPEPALKFTVKAGLTTEVVLENSRTTSSSSSKLTVSKSVYVDDNGDNIPVYAYGTTDPVYFALFSNSSHTEKVSNVLKLSMSGYTGTITFSNLKEREIYYVAETDENGIVLSSTDSHKIVYRNGTTARETSSGKMEITKNSQTMSVDNIYTSLPSGYRYAVDLTIKKNVTDSSGSNPLAVSETFYAGLFRNSDYSDTPIIVPLSCNNSSSASASKRVLLSGENSVTYYIAEIDANGNRITDSSDFGYYPPDPQTVTLTKKDVNSGKSVVFTNRTKDTNKVTLTLSKRVYEGSDPLPVDETFYVGLYKDENLTTLYTSPIAMNLSDADSLTLKLTLNIGNKTDATVYIAEVDASGNLVQSSKEFGYSCYVANNKVVFSQSRKSAQSVLVNFVYGTDTRDAIDSVLGDLDDYFGDEDFTFDENGDFYGDGSVDTGDTTPIAGCAAVMAASLLIFALSWRRRRRAR